MTKDDRRIYLVEAYASTADASSVAAATRRLSGSDHGTRHLGTLVIAAEETCLSVFEGPDAQAVAAVNLAAGLPMDRIVEAEWFAGRPGLGAPGPREE